MPQSHRITRRNFLGAVTATAIAGIAVAGVMFAGAGLAPLSAQTAGGDLREVTMRLDWVFHGPNAGFIVAQDKGFYEEVGLKADIGPGKGSGSTAQLVASKASQFGFADGYVVANSVAKGMELTMVASIYRRNPTAVVALKESGIETAKDLEGKSVAIPTGATQFQQWPAYLKGCDVDESKVNVINIDVAGSVPALITGKVDAIAGYAQGYVPGVEVRGNKEANILWYADCGVTAISNGIIVHNDLLEEDPDLIRAFVEASVRGFLYARENPEEAIAIIEKYATAADPAILKREMELSWQTWVTEATRGQPLGWMAPEDWNDTIANLKQYGDVGSDLDADSLYTNDFVPSGDAYLPPQPDN